MRLLFAAFEVAREDVTSILPMLQASLVEVHGDAILTGPNHC